MFARAGARVCVLWRNNSLLNVRPTHRSHNIIDGHKCTARRRHINGHKRRIVNEWELRWCLVQRERGREVADHDMWSVLGVWLGSAQMLWSNRAISQNTFSWWVAWFHIFVFCLSFPLWSFPSIQTHGISRRRVLHYNLGHSWAWLVSLEFELE